MPKFKVTIEETALYLIEVEAEDEDAASEAAEEVFVQTEDRDAFFTSVVERDAVQIVKVK